MAQKQIRAIAGRISAAALSGGTEPLEAVVHEVDATTPSGKAAAALRAWAGVEEGDTDAAEAQRRIDAALQDPPDDLELLVLVMNRAVRLALHRGDRSSAQRLVNRLKQIDDPDTRPPIKAQRHLAEAELHAGQADFETAYHLMCEAVKLGVEPGSRVWWTLLSSRIDYAFRCGFLDQADRDIDLLLRHTDPNDSDLTAKCAFYRIRRNLIACETDKAEQLLESLTPQQVEAYRPHVTYCRLSILIDSGRFAQADALLDAVDPGQFSAEFVLQFRAYMALMRGRLDDVRHYARLSLEAQPTSYDEAITQHYFVLADLAEGRAAEARRGLTRLDPRGDQPRFYIEWARLHALENDEPTAARYYRRFVDRFPPAQLETNLRWAYELSSYQLARIHRLAMALDDGEAQHAAAPVAPAVEPPRSNGQAEAVIEQRFIGRHPLILETRRKLLRFATLDAPVLLTGETGTGKEIAARLLHDLSDRAAEPFTAINCGGLTDTLIESELFGHVKGAFTGAVRDHHGLFLDTGRGTIFLDEINAMTPRLQAALLRVLESGEVRPVGGTRVRNIHCRIIAASNESLEHAVADHRFRADLFYRLSRLTVDLPPLRDRLDDLELLTAHFLQSTYGRLDVVVGKDLLAAMRAYHWPGNVRELKNELERITLMAGDQQLLTADLFRKAPRPAPQPVAAHNSRHAEQPDLPALPDGNLRNTHHRRRILKQLFDQHDRLTRADIIRLLGCAPNTATKDLRDLEDEGFIRRIHTSAHLRTSYFIRQR